MNREELIEEAAKALTGLTDVEWEIATAEGTEHLTGYFEAAERVLSVFEQAHTPTDPAEYEHAARYVVKRRTDYGDRVATSVLTQPLTKRAAMERLNSLKAECQNPGNYYIEKWEERA